MPRDVFAVIVCRAGESTEVFLFDMLDGAVAFIDKEVESERGAHVDRCDSGADYNVSCVWNEFDSVNYSIKVFNDFIGFDEVYVMIREHSDSGPEVLLFETEVEAMHFIDKSVADDEADGARIDRDHYNVMCEWGEWGVDLVIVTYGFEAQRIQNSVDAGLVSQR